jgi:hypothetical protein
LPEWDSFEKNALKGFKSMLWKNTCWF